jgi:hypothetical protein
MVSVQNSVLAMVIRPYRKRIRICSGHPPPLQCCEVLHISVKSGRFFSGMHDDWCSMMALTYYG